MRKARALSWICIVALLLSIGVPAAKAEDSNWWENDLWTTQQLADLGAVAPSYNAAAQQYEISTPEQLLFLSGTWKPEDGNGDGVSDAPCDGVYVLTQDLDMQPLMDQISAELTRHLGAKTAGYMPPIAALTDEGKDGGVKCSFFGTFDGQGHTISNLRIERMQQKYAGLFGNVGHDEGEGYVRNLALINMEVKCLASCGLIVGGLYGDVEHCVAIGTIDCLQKTAGGIAGKVKKNDNGYLGTVRDCFVYADITVRGDGGENGAVGGITSAQSDGGRIYNCYVCGSITVLGEQAESVGGVTGNLKSGQALENTLMLLREINVVDGKLIGLLCGDYAGETGSHLVNNYVFSGTQLSGGVTSDHPDTAAFTDANATTILSKAFFTDQLGWDFDSLWTWIGDDASGYPMLKQFTGRGGTIEEMLPRIQSDLALTKPVLRAAEPLMTKAYAGDAVPITCMLTLPESARVNSATLLYGADKDSTAFTDSIPMTDNGDGSFTALFPEAGIGEYFYSITADVDGKTLLYPNQQGESIRLELVSPEAKYQPKQLTLSPGADQTQVGICWVTETGDLTAKLLYRVAGGSDWTTANVSEIETVSLANGRGSLTSYSVDLTGLTPDTQYEYRAVTNNGADEYATETASFTTLPAGNAFTCVLGSDLQSTTEEGYLPFLDTMDTFVKDQLGGTDFVINLGDLTEDGSSPVQWRSMFQTLGGQFASTLTAFVAGNHEGTSDPNDTIYKAQTNLPGGVDDSAIKETTGSFVAGDVCFVMLNTDPYSNLAGADVVADKAAFYEKEKAYAKQAFEASGCNWRVLVAHAGLIQDDPDATAFIESMCDELDVDLYFNGHIHDYYRATVRNGAAAEVGAGTTYITTSPMGMKFDDFVTGKIDELLQYQTGGSDDERQYFTQIAASDTGLTVTAYQLAEPGDVTKPESFANYSVIDSITLQHSLSSQHSAQNLPEVPDATVEIGDGVAWWQILLIAAAGVLIAGIVLVLVRKNAKKAGG
ncbi:MAG: metallophosphoesterase family protein [Clostridiaceae bacterium]